MQVRTFDAMSGQTVRTAIVVTREIWMLRDDRRTNIHYVREALFRELKPIALGAEYVTYIDSTNISQVLVMDQCEIGVADLCNSERTRTLTHEQSAEIHGP